MNSSLRLAQQSSEFTLVRREIISLVAAVSAAIDAAVGHLDDAARLLADVEHWADADADADPPAPVLRVDIAMRWFEAPGGARVVCANRPVMRRILGALIEARSASPARSLSAFDLVRSGWPDERIRPDAAKNRLHVMLTRLRGHGLRGVLVGDDLGYALAREVTIEVVEEDDGMSRRRDDGGDEA